MEEATQRDESASSKQDVTAAASVQSAAAFNDLSGEQLSVHDYLYISTHESADSRPSPHQTSTG